MILKDKETIQASDPRIKSGDDAERQMAHYLKREFGKQDDCFVLNDLRLLDVSDQDEIAQIDHLLVTRYGFFLVESKAGDIKVDARGQWIRGFDGRETGMQSAVNQAERQGKLLRELVQANREELRRKYLFGKIQGGFLFALVECFVAVSDKGIIRTEIDIQNLDKADNIPKLIRKRMEILEEKNKLLSLRNLFSTEVVWEMTLEETKAVAEFLLRQHKPINQFSLLAKEGSSLPLQGAEKTNSDISLKQATSAAQRPGAVCPKCAKGKLERRSVKRADGTETDFLACSMHPKDCTALFPFVALVQRGQPEASSVKSVATSETRKEGGPCPKCTTGHLVRHNGKNGKPPFFGCSNFKYRSKDSCNFMKSIE